MNRNPYLAEWTADHCPSLHTSYFHQDCKQILHFQLHLLNLKLENLYCICLIFERKKFFVFAILNQFIIKSIRKMVSWWMGVWVEKFDSIGNCMLFSDKNEHKIENQLMGIWMHSMIWSKSLYGCCEWIQAMHNSNREMSLNSLGEQK